MDLIKLAEDIIDGYRLTKDQNLSFFVNCDYESLCKGADMIRARYSGNHVDLCSIINGKSGKCPENCRFCAQSAHSNTGCEVYSFLDKDKILATAKANEEEGVARFSIVTSGRSLSGDDFEKALDCYKTMNKELKIGLCASHGFLTRQQLRRLYEAGVRSYHHNIETSQRNFPNICTTHTFEMKINTIKMAQEEGLSVCSGGIIGMGETWEDRISMALTLSELNIRSIPINALMPIKGSPLGELKRLSEEEVLRTIAIFRYINPEANIRLAAGRALMYNNGENAFKSGASASITGNMLTTSGSTIKSDKEMLISIGRESVPFYNSDCCDTCCSMQMHCC